MWDKTCIQVVKLEKTRKQLNRFLRCLVEHNGGIFINHEDISVVVCCFFELGLGLVGNDLVLLNATCFGEGFFFHE